MKKDRESSSLHPSSFILEPSSTHRPSKRFGQNFLTEKSTINRIVEALNPQRDETIVEIGPGRGALTAPLIKRAGRLVAIEFDRNLIPFINNEFGKNENFKLVESDALITDICGEIRPAATARVLANLPYNIATAVLQRLIEQRACLTELILMLQREVVDRIMAPAGSADRGYLSVIVEAYCQAEKLFDVAPGSFRPTPKVWSSVVRLRLRPKVGFDGQEEKLLWQVVSAGFAQRRKTILNNLRSAPPYLQEQLQTHGGASIVLCRAEVELQRRAETLALDDWIRILRALT
ncbi:MAG: 16S rRNA (adenine(1518)-N(6)/adenine(1519)-N(6))-dimethyltransferase RsmA [Pyrinomonadaceae bacterium]